MVLQRDEGWETAYAAGATWNVGERKPRMTIDDPGGCRLDAIEAEFRTWRQAHPEATLTELEVALDSRLRVARARLLSEVAGDLPPALVPCPDCGQPLRPSGTRSRTLLTHGAQPLNVTRPYLRCPACGAGLFPPG